MLQDLRLTLRHLAKARGFAFVATFTLAVGIGSSTAMFSALRALVVQPFDYPDAAEIVQVWSGDRWPLSPADYHSLQEQMTSFETFGVYQPGTVNLGAENAQAIAGIRATAGVLPSFGVQAWRGRLLEPADALAGAEPVAVIGYGLWQQTFASDPTLLGRTIRLNGEDVTVVGILPPDFEFSGPWVRMENIQVYRPYHFSEDELKMRDSHWLCGVARLRDGVSIAVADAEIKAIGQQLSALYPNSNTNKAFLVRSLHFEMTRDVGQQVWMLFGAVALVLLVACANVASMLLARSAQRQGEFAVRVALGATRTRLVRLALTESFVLAALGTALGLFVAWGGIEVLRAIAPVSPARKIAMALDGQALLFACAAALLTSLLAGIPPALTAARTSLGGVIRTDARGAVGSRSRHAMLRALVVAQIAVAFILANGAALFSASYVRIMEQNRTLDTDEVLTAKLHLRSDTYDKTEDRVRFWQRLEDHLATLPGVTAVGLTSKLPLEGGSNTSALVNDEVYDPAARRTNVERSSISSRYFETMGLRLLTGRKLTPADDMSEDGHLGVVVNQAFVDKAWPDKNPIGEVFRANQPADPWYTATVVGVVENVRQWGPTAAVQPEMYTTPPRHWGETVHINLRSTQPADYLAPLLRQAIDELDRELALEDVRTLGRMVRDNTAGERAVAGLVDFFMAVALGLVAVGLYGTLSYHIVQRTREIGVRLAIGALGADILRMVFGQGLRWMAFGLLLGAAGIWGLASVLESVVYGMDGLTASPLLLAGAAVMLATVVATLIPAWRASRLDPVVALRND